MFEIIILRHGKSPPLEEAGVSSDRKRPLSDVGRKQAESAGKALRKMDFVPEIILTSPFLRARETAERAGERLKKDVPIKAVESLSPGADCEALAAGLRDLEKVSRIMIVGHQPDLGDFASYLVFGKDSGQIAIKPGGMVLVEMESLHTGSLGKLRWLLTPDLIKSL